MTGNSFAGMKTHAPLQRFIPESDRPEGPRRNLRGARTRFGARYRRIARDAWPDAKLIPRASSNLPSKAQTDRSIRAAVPSGRQE